MPTPKSIDKHGVGHRAQREPSGQWDQKEPTPVMKRGTEFIVKHDAGQRAQREPHTVDENSAEQRDQNELIPKSRVKNSAEQYTERSSHCHQEWR